MKSNDIKSFEQACTIINLATEYPGFIGDTPYAIITDLSEEDLNARFEIEISPYRPFVILTSEMGSVIIEHHQNEDKYTKRVARGEVSLSNISDYVGFYQSLIVNDAATTMDLEESLKKPREIIIDSTLKALMTLSPRQQNYLIRHYAYKVSLKTLAEETGTHRNNVLRVCQRGRNKFIKAMEEMGIPSMLERISHE